MNLFENNFMKDMFHSNEWNKNNIKEYKNENIVEYLNPSKKTLNPVVTGTSILALKYQDGIMMMADTLASYGSLARFRDVRRIQPLGKYTIIGGTGEYSDFQYIIKILEELVNEHEITDEDIHLSPSSIHSYLTRVMYQRRNKFDPLWNSIVIGGFYKQKSFLGLCDLRGTSYQDETIATGFGDYIARPLMRKHFKENMTFIEANSLLETCMRVLFYRDARSLNRIQRAIVTSKGIEISEPYELDTDWKIGEIKYHSDIITIPTNYENNNNLEL
jgi:20S proteasome subunit beta 7